MGDSFAESGEKRQIVHIDANNLYGWSMGQYLPNEDTKFMKIVELEDISNTPNESNVGFFVEVDLNFSDNIKKNKKLYSFSNEQKANISDFTEYVKSNKPKSYRPHDKLICDWYDK